jgi:hypothetical protein
MTTCAPGLRAGEVRRLKPKHIIDSERMPIKVIDGNGSKDRYTMLSKRLLAELLRTSVLVWALWGGFFSANRPPTLKMCTLAQPSGG